MTVSIVVYPLSYTQTYMCGKCWFPKYLCKQKYFHVTLLEETAVKTHRPSRGKHLSRDGGNSRDCCADLLSCDKSTCSSSSELLH